MSAIAGKVFFPALCLGTGFLGCWQSKRYFEKVELIERQDLLLKAGVDAPSSSLDVDFADGLSHVVTLSGTFRHQDECVVGPRGPPPGALAKDGPMSGRGGGGLSSSPQGFYVISPFVLRDGRVVLVNRGWDSVSHLNADYDRPDNVVDLTVVTSSCEEGGMFSPPPISPFKKNTGRSQPTLLWLEEEALRTLTNITKTREPKLRMLKEVVSSGGGLGTGKGRTLVRPTIEQAVEFKVQPETHAGYAATWFSLSAAGVFMTRKLLKNVPK